MANTRYQATGKRKSSIARVIMEPGKGEIVINGKDVNEYFSDAVLVQKINVPFNVTQTTGEYNVVVNVNGGGTTGQAEAIMYGISKSLLQVNDDMRVALKAEGLLTRDARVKERKKYGLKKARKSPQFSKR